MRDKHYGSIVQRVNQGSIDRHLEEILVRGYTVVEHVIPQKELPTWRSAIDLIYEQQEKEFGREKLAAIQELDVCRAPLLYDRRFVELATLPKVIEIVSAILGQWFILNLQNAIINRPNVVHHQSSWHRDLPHQNFVISRPLAVNALLTIDEFSEVTGGTQVLPFSHKQEILPSDDFIDQEKSAVIAPSGSAIIFDCMLLHRAGSNNSTVIRRAVNQLYTVPIIKQQYDFARVLGAYTDWDPPTARLLGITSQVPLDDKAWRTERAKRISDKK